MGGSPAIWEQFPNLTVFFIEGFPLYRSLLFLDKDLPQDSPSIKKTVKFGKCSQIAGDPPTLAYLGILNCYFFIGYLGLLDHEMDFEIKLFFSFTKVA